jgi:hypothetical protein
LAITIACKCGRQLRAQEVDAGKKVQCPGCGRAHVLPAPAGSALAQSAWQVDMSPEATKKAEAAGAITPGRANTIRLFSRGELHGNLHVEGALVCWYCKARIPFSGQVFGRVGFGGAFVQLSCPQCNARIWTGYSTHVTGEGTEVYLYAPTLARHYTRAENEPLPAPVFRIDRVSDSSTDAARNDWVDTLLSGLVMAVTRHDPYQEVSASASQLVGQAITPTQVESVARSLRVLLERERTLFIRTILVESVACLRDEAAARTVQSALRRTLEEEDPSDATHLPLHDLCVLSLLYGDGNGFLEAMSQGLDKVTVTTRARKAGKRLTPREVADLITKGEQIDNYESTLGGANWQYVYPLLPLWVGDDEPKKDPSGKRWLNRLFGRP